MSKRVFDIILSLVLLVSLSWVLLFSWLLALIDTHTNGIFIQERIGQYGKPFNIYKLRTLYIDAKSGGMVASRIGQLLRNYKVDELPQLVNVLLGDMSPVGPRPDVAGYNNLLEGDSRKILELKPGLTSNASLKYAQEEKILKKKQDPLNWNDTVIFPDKVKMNLDYYYNRSFWGDIVIILKNFKIIFLPNKLNKDYLF